MWWSLTGSSFVVDMLHFQILSCCLESFNDSLLETGQSSNNMVLMLTHSISTGSNLRADFGVLFTIKMPNLLCTLAVRHKYCRQQKHYRQTPARAISGRISVYKGAKMSSLMKHLTTHGIQSKAEGCTTFDSYILTVCQSHQPAVWVFLGPLMWRQLMMMTRTKTTQAAFPQVSLVR